MISIASFANVQNVLCLGAHCDDIEIGAGGTILSLISAYPHLKFHWVVFGGKDCAREQEARAAVAEFLHGSAGYSVDIQAYDDSFFQYSGEAIKKHFSSIHEAFAADVIFTHHGDDRHQDHRLISEFTWNTFRNHQILDTKSPSGTAISPAQPFTTLSTKPRCNKRLTCSWNSMAPSAVKPGSHPIRSKPSCVCAASNATPLQDLRKRFIHAKS